MNENEAIKILKAVDNEQKARSKIGEVLAVVHDAGTNLKRLRSLAAGLEGDIADLRTDLEALGVQYESDKAKQASSLAGMKTNYRNIKEKFDEDGREAASALEGKKDQLERAIGRLQPTHDATVARLDAERDKHIKDAADAKRDLAAIEEILTKRNR